MTEGDQAIARHHRFFGLRTWRRWLAGNLPAGPARGAVRAQAARFALAGGLVRGFYAFSLFLVVGRLPDLVRQAVPARPFLLWPVAWLSWVQPSTVGVGLVVALLLGGAALAAFVPQRRWARTLAALGWLEFVALENSAVKIGHSLHLMVVVSAVLVFLPWGWHWPARVADRMLRQRTLLVFWTAQAAVFLTYSLSGLGKFAGAFYQFTRGEIGVFSPNALAYHVADRLLQTASVSVLGQWLIDYPFLGWPGMLLTVYLQLTAFAVVFRPALQRWWAAGLAAFHVVSFFTMTINFPQNVFLLALFFFHSPFAPADTPPLRELLGEAPLLGPLVRRALTGTGKHAKGDVRPSAAAQRLADGNAR